MSRFITEKSYFFIFYIFKLLVKRIIKNPFFFYAYIKIIYAHFKDCKLWKKLHAFRIMLKICTFYETFIKLFGKFIFVYLTALMCRVSSLPVYAFLPAISWARMQEHPRRTRKYVPVCGVHGGWRQQPRELGWRRVDGKGSDVWGTGSWSRPTLPWARPDSKVRCRWDTAGQ